MTLVAGLPPIVGGVLARASGADSDHAKASAQSAPSRGRTAALQIIDIMTTPWQNPS
jgi:hypothetical protein